MSEISRERLRKARWRALTDFKYSEAIRLYERYGRLQSLTHKDLCDLGLFYDHRAQKRRSKELIRKDESRALDFYREVLKSDRRSKEAVSGIARVYWHRKDSRALEYYRKAINLYPGNERWMAYQNLGNAYFFLKKYRDTERYYLKAIRLGAKGHGFFYNLTQLYYFMGDKKRTSYYSRKANKYLESYWGSKPKSAEYRLTKKLLKEINEGAL